MKQGGFAAAFLRGLDADVGGYVASFEEISMDDPQGQGLGSPSGQDHKLPEEGDESIEQGFAIHRLGPWLDVLQ